jgi:hypothetical protein
LCRVETDFFSLISLSLNPFYPDYFVTFILQFIFYVLRGLFRDVQLLCERHGLELSLAYELFSSSGSFTGNYFTFSFSIKCCGCCIFTLVLRSVESHCLLVALYSLSPSWQGNATVRAGEWAFFAFNLSSPVSVLTVLPIFFLMVNARFRELRVGAVHFLHTAQRILLGKCRWAKRTSAFGSDS